MSLYVNSPPAAGNGWYGIQQSFLSAAIPQLTQFEYVKFGQVPGGQALTLQAGLADGTTEGGALTIGNIAAVRLQSASSYQIMKTGRWGFSIRMKCSAIAAGLFALVGFSNAAFSQFVTIGVNQAEDGTNFLFRLFDSVTVAFVPLTAADTAWHTFAMTFDLTTVTGYIDGVAAGSTATLTRLTDGARWFGGHASAAGTATVSRLIYGFVDP